jgi:uncharacterized protein DUF3313
MRQFSVIALAIVAMGVGGCASTQQAKSVDNSGFLGDYSILKPGGEKEALLNYKSPAADWKKYRKVQLDPVTIWLGPESKLKDIPTEDRQRLANLLWTQFNDQLSKDYEMTTQAGPDVLRFQMAITEGDESNVALDTISSVIPQLKMVSGAKSLATGVSMFTGSAAIEGKATDGATGTVLWAGVDRRGGTKSFSGMTNSWGDVEESYRYWAELARFRLCQWRAGSACVEPSEKPRDEE